MMLVFGAHPDDIEFGCGGIIAAETRRAQTVHLVICSRGESASHGTPEERVREAERAADLLGAGVEWLDLGGDAHFRPEVAHALVIAALIRRHRPTIVLAPTLEENQHPDHAILGKLVRDACRLARYGGVDELRDLKPHAPDVLWLYAITPGAEPPGAMPVLVDVSAVVDIWKAAMEAHLTQTSSREYVELQLARAHGRGLSAGVAYAIALFPNDPLLLEHLGHAPKSARRF